MMRQGVLFHPKRFGDLGRANALRCKAHQQAEYGHPAGMSERGEGMNGAALFHISRL
jgi:hypothetical protein